MSELDDTGLQNGQNNDALYDPVPEVKKIEHINRDNLEYFARQFHSHILAHIKMSDIAQEYYQKEYMKLFSKDYSFSVSLKATPSNIKPKELAGESQQVVLDAKFDCVFTVNTPDGTTVSHPAISNVDVPEGWTQSSSGTFTKTITVDDFRSNKTESITGTVHLFEPYEEGATIGSETVKASTTITITRPNLWFSEVAEMTPEVFSASYKGAKEFSTGKNKEFQSVAGYPLVFMSTSKNLNFEQSGNSIIQKKETIQTSLGEYTVYYTGKSNGSIWNSVTIS